MANRRHSLFTALLFMFPTFAHAGEWIRPGMERFTVSAGVFLPEFDTDLRVDSKALGKGVTIDLEDDLSLKEKVDTGYFSLDWRPFDKHRFGAAYYVFNRDTSATAITDIKLNDGKIIQAGATLTTGFELDVIPFSYAYSFINSETHELSGTLGVHWTTIDFRVDASAWLADEDATGRVDAEADGPLPLVGVDYRYNVSDRWTAGAGLEFFYIELDDDVTAFTGGLYNVRVNTEYWPWQNLGIGAAINFFGLDVDVEDDEWRGALEYDYWGPQIYLKARF